MKVSEEVRKLRGFNLKCLLDRCNLKQTDLCIYGLGLYDSTISAFIKGNTKQYITRDQAYKLRDIFRYLKRDFPEKNIIVPSIEYLLGEVLSPTMEEVKEAHKMGFEMENDILDEDVYSLLGISMKNHGYYMDDNGWFYPEYSDNVSDEFKLHLFYKDNYNLILDNDIPDKVITNNDFEEFKSKLLEYSNYLAWQILNKDK